MTAQPPAATPAWRRRTEVEHRWAAAGAIGVLIVIQLLLPDRLSAGPS